MGEQTYNFYDIDEKYIMQNCTQMCYIKVLFGHSQNFETIFVSQIGHILYFFNSDLQKKTKIVSLQNYVIGKLRPKNNFQFKIKNDRESIILRFKEKKNSEDFY